MSRASGRPPEDATVELRRGRRAAPYTDQPDWVGLSDKVSAPAHSLYAKMKMHLNMSKGDTVCFAGKDSLAEMMHVAKTDTLDPWIAQLAEVGAIDVVLTNTMPARCEYIVHDEPPEGYTGPRTVADWYRLHRAAIAARRVAGKAKRDRARRRAEAHRAGQPCLVPHCTREACIAAAHAAGRSCGGVKGCDRREACRAAITDPTTTQVTPDTPSEGYQDDPGTDTPVAGYLDTPPQGYSDTPVAGWEQPTTSLLVVAVDEGEQERRGTGGTLPPGPPTDPAPSGVGTDKPGQTYVPSDVLPQGGNRNHRPHARAESEPAVLASHVVHGTLPRSDATRPETPPGSPGSPETEPRVPAWARRNRTPADEALRRILDAAGVPDDRRPLYVESELLSAWLAAALLAWSVDRLERHLVPALQIVSPPEATETLIDLLRELPPTPPAEAGRSRANGGVPRQRPTDQPCPNPHCDSHTGGRGFVETPTGVLERCPDCYPPAPTLLKPSTSPS